MEKKTEKELFLAAVKDAFPLKKNPNKASVKKAKPKRTIIVLLSFFAGLVFAMPLAIYFDKRKL